MSDEAPFCSTSHRNHTVRSECECEDDEVEDNDEIDDEDEDEDDSTIRRTIDEVEISTRSSSASFGS